MMSAGSGIDPETGKHKCLIGITFMSLLSLFGNRCRADINFVFPMLSSSGSFFVFGCRIGNICTVNIMPERTIKTEDIYHHDILRYHPRTFLFLQGPPGSFFYRLGDRLSGIGYEVRYLNISGGDVFDRPLFCRSSCFRGRPEQWENYLGEFISQKRISDIVLYDAGGFYHAAARAVSRKSGIRVWVYDTLRGFPGTVILHRDFDDDEAVVIPKNGRNQEVCERHSPASVSSGDGSMVFRGASFWNRLGTVLLAPFFRHYVPKNVSSGLHNAGAGIISGGVRFFFFPLPLSSQFRSGVGPLESAGSAVTLVIESFARFSGAGDHLVIRGFPYDGEISGIEILVADLSRKLALDSRIHFTDCADFDLAVRNSSGVAVADFYDGLRALELGRPVIVLRPVCYAAPGLAVSACAGNAFSAEILNGFWTNPPRPDAEEVLRFCGVMRERYQVSGKDLAGDEASVALDASMQLLGIGGIRNCIIFSRPIARIKNIRLFLDSVAIPAVVGWGHKPTARRARRYARRHGLPYHALEDGFIKSVATSFRGRDEEIVSLVFDRTGIYYDANSDSELESWMIRSSEWFTEDLRIRSKRLIDCILAGRIVKYNVLENGDTGIPENIPDDAILIIDQTLNDASIPQGNADAGTFREMLEDAVAGVGAGKVYVKEHPNVVSGMGRGYYSIQDLKKRGVNIITSAINALDLLRNFRNVYVVTSGTGFEALLSGCRVTCFGEPFYSGYGLTCDRKSFARGKRLSKMKTPASLELLVAAVFYRYCIFVNPETLRICAPEEAVEYILARKNGCRRSRGDSSGNSLPE